MEKSQAAQTKVKNWFWISSMRFYITESRLDIAYEKQNRYAGNTLYTESEQITFTDFRSAHKHVRYNQWSGLRCWINLWLASYLHFVNCESVELGF